MRQLSNDENCCIVAGWLVVGGCWTREHNACLMMRRAKTLVDAIETWEKRGKGDGSEKDKEQDCAATDRVYTRVTAASVPTSRRRENPDQS